MKESAEYLSKKLESESDLSIEQTEQSIEKLEHPVASVEYKNEDRVEIEKEGMR